MGVDFGMFSPIEVFHVLRHLKPQQKRSMEGPIDGQFVLFGSPRTVTYFPNVMFYQIIDNISANPARRHQYGVVTRRVHYFLKFLWMNYPNNDSEGMLVLLSCLDADCEDIIAVAMGPRTYSCVAPPSESENCRWRNVGNRIAHVILQKEQNESTDLRDV